MENVFKFIDKFDDFKLIQIVIDKMNDNFGIEKKIAENRFSPFVFIYCDMIANIKITIRICCLLVLDGIIHIASGSSISFEQVKNIIEYIKKTILGFVFISQNDSVKVLNFNKRLNTFKDIYKSIIIEKYFLLRIVKYNYPSLELKTYLHKIGGKTFQKMISLLIKTFDNLEMDTKQLRSIEINYTVFENIDF